MYVPCPSRPSTGASTISGSGRLSEPVERLPASASKRRIDHNDVTTGSLKRSVIRSGDAATAEPSAGVVDKSTACAEAAVAVTSASALAATNGTNRIAPLRSSMRISFLLVAVLGRATGAATMKSACARRAARGMASG